MLSLSLKKRILQTVLVMGFVFLIGGQPFLPRQVQAHSQQRALTAELSSFIAIYDDQGIDIEWQVSGDGIDWQFSVLRSQNCQLESAEQVSAPMFSSINDETQIVYYSMTDIDEPLIATCGYWLVATKEGGNQQHFGPYAVQGRHLLYLPLAVQS